MSTILIVITVVSLAVAAVTSFVAWRARLEAQRRSEARIEALARDITGQTTAGETGPDGAPRLFARAQPSQESRASLAAAAGIVIVGTAIALVVVLSSTAGPMASSRPQGAEVLAQSLELVALSHERPGGGLTVRGAVRNPTGGPAINRLAAVVTLFGADGRLVGTLRDPLRDAPLRPDDQASFLVTLADASLVERFRVSFYAGDRVIPHVDTRDSR